MEKSVSIRNASMEKKCRTDEGLEDSRKPGGRWSHTWSLMSVGKVVSRQIHWGVLDLVYELRLIHGIVSMLNWVSCVNHIDLRKHTHIPYYRDRFIPIQLELVLIYRNNCANMILLFIIQTAWKSSTVKSAFGSPYLDLEVIADVPAIEFWANQLELPIKQSLCVPVSVTDEMEDLLVVGHGVYTWTQTRTNHKLESKI